MLIKPRMSSYRPGRGRGALRGSLPVVGTPISPGGEQILLSEDAIENEEEPDTSEFQLLDIRVTEILDVTTFWAQIGTGRFNLLLKALLADDNLSSVHVCLCCIVIFMIDLCNA